MMKPEKSEKHEVYSIERGGVQGHESRKTNKSLIKKIDSQIPANYPNKNCVARTLQQNINNFLAELPEQEISGIMQKKKNTTSFYCIMPGLHRNLFCGSCTYELLGGRRSIDY